MIDEGYTKYQCNWRHMPAIPADDFDDLIEWRNRLYAEKLVGYNKEHDVGYGNLSIRADDTNQFIISGTQTGHIPRTDRKQYSLVTSFDIENNYVTCEGPVQASSEALTHAALYTLDRKINAIAHVHSSELWAKLKYRVPTTSPDVPYGTPEMADEFLRLYRDTELAERGVAVMAGHAEGIVAIGGTMEQAAQRILELLL
jgi:ribulose-5-phosphate 4-epimerase/fuculose-1-phosphate aldolase